MQQTMDGGFFENLTALQWKLKNRRHQIVNDAHAEFDRQKHAEKHRVQINKGAVAGVAPDTEKFLYLQCLYMLRYGRTASPASPALTNGTPPTDSLVSFLQNMSSNVGTGHSPGDSPKMLSLLLNIDVIKAKNLVAKDTNGFSDPYCMLGIIPGTPNSSNGTPLSPFPSRESFAGHSHLRRGDSHGTIPSPDATSSSPNEHRQSQTNLTKKSPNEFGSRKSIASTRFNFRKSFIRSKREPSLVAVNAVLPAKFMKVTAVQHKTLSPIWNEHFQFELDDLADRYDRFHLDIWDLDEDESVMDAVKRLNEVKGVKGLGRYFKQVAHSARGCGEELDDFLGAVSVKISEIPLCGIQKWYLLAGRSVRSSVRGEIELKISFGVNIDSEFDASALHGTLLPVEQHKNLVGLFAEHQLIQLGNQAAKWSGDLSPTALAILREHAAQTKITPRQEVVCYWCTYVRTLRVVPIDIGIAMETFQELENSWAATCLPKYEEDVLVTSIMEFLTFAYDQIQAHRDLFHVKSRSSTKKLTTLVKCLTLMYQSSVFHKCLPFKKNFKSELVYALKKSAHAHFDKCTQEVMGINNAASTGYKTTTINEMIQLTSHLSAACHQAHHYQAIFKKECGVNYSLISYNAWLSLLRACLDLDMIVHQPIETEHQIAEVFDLFLTLSEFVAYRGKLDTDDNACHSSTLSSNGLELEVWFEEPIRIWLQRVRQKCTARIDLALDADKLPMIASKEGNIKNPSSGDIVDCIQQIVTFWNLLSISDGNQHINYLLNVIKVLIEVLEYYAHKALAGIVLPKTANSALSPNRKGHINIPAALTEQICRVINDVETMRKCAKQLPTMLLFDDVKLKIQEQMTEADAEAKIQSLVEPTTMANKDLAAWIEKSLKEIILLRRDEIRKHVFHLAWSPVVCKSSETIQPLIKYLDSRLMKFHKWLLTRNFHRLLKIQFDIVLREIQYAAAEYSGDELGFYRNLDESVEYLVEFYNADGKGPERDHLIELEVYQILKRVFGLKTMTTNDLIMAYYWEQHAEQKTLESSEFGTLNIDVQYIAERYIVSLIVQNASNLISLDANGLSDPFVIIELVPRCLFPDVEPIKTKVQMKTLDPQFEEEFQITLPKLTGACSERGLIHFIVMDYDYLTSNDFAGEAFLPLKEFCVQHTSPNKLSASKSYYISYTFQLLNQKTIPEPSPMAVIKSRTDDKAAQEFLRHSSAVMSL